MNEYEGHEHSVTFRFGAKTNLGSRVDFDDAKGDAHAYAVAEEGK